MRISDWSSDVCSSDLMVGDHQMDHAAEGAVAQQRKACVGAANVGQQGAHEALRRDRPLPALCKACRKASRHAVTSLAAIALYMARQRSWRALIGRVSASCKTGSASCRERGWQYVKTT